MTPRQELIELAARRLIEDINEQTTTSIRACIEYIALHTGRKKLSSYYRRVSDNALIRLDQAVWSRSKEIQHERVGIIKKRTQS